MGNTNSISYDWALDKKYFYGEPFKVVSPKFSAPNDDRLWSITLEYCPLSASDSTRVFFYELNLHKPFNNPISGELKVCVGRPECKYADRFDLNPFVLFKKKFEFAPSSVKWTSKVRYEYFEFLVQMHSLYGKFQLKTSFSFDVPLFTSENDYVVDVDHLCADFEQLFKDKDFSDITITANNKRYPVHKCVLAARSSVFKAMLHTNMRERYSNCINIVDVKERVLEVMLQYMYTGKVPDVNASLIFDLFSAADKYDLKGLRNICEQRLRAIMTEINVLEIALLADSHSANGLKQHAIEYIKDHRYDESLKDDLLKKLPKCDVDLMKEIVAVLMTK